MEPIIPPHGDYQILESYQNSLIVFGVARASLEEMLEDYRDYLRTHGLPLWKKDDKRALAVRRLARRKDKTYKTYRSYMVETGDNAEVFCNVVISLIHQTNFLLDRRIKSLEKSFVQKGGLRERMYRARVDARNAQPQPDTKRALVVLRGLYRDIRETALDEDAKAGLLRKVECVADFLKGPAGSGSGKSHAPEVKP